MAARNSGGQPAREEHEIEERLRRVLGEALAKAGYGLILFAKDVDLKPKPHQTALGFFIAVALIAPAAMGARQLLGLPWIVTAVAFVLLLIGFSVVAGKRPPILFGVMAAWAVGLVLELVVAPWSTWMTTFGWPLLVISGAALLYSAMRMLATVDPGGLIRSSPLLFPVVLLLLFFPLLSADVWRAIGSTDAIHLAILGVAALGPVLYFLYLQLLGSLEAICRAEADALAAEGSEVTIGRLAKYVDKESAVWARYYPQTVEAGLRCSEFSRYVAATVRPVLRRRLAAALALVLLGGGLIVFAYIYLLALSAVDIGVAAEWSRAPITTSVVNVLGLSIELAGGPYLRVAGLLTVLTLAAFVALILTEERFSNTLAEALINRPVRALLGLCLPYLHLAEKRLLSERSP